MAKNLVIVESPTKAKTITRFLGSDYKVLASMGHVRDLPKSKMGIDTEHDFEPVYIIPVAKRKIVKELKDELKDSEQLWLATDSDREGEAIGWHLLSALNVDAKKTPVHRIVFHEITEGAIKDAIANPREIDKNIVDAQQARRVLDRLVGYELSPLLWKKIRYGLSAGRVQSVAVRLVVEREREILAFKPEEFWRMDGIFDKNPKADLSIEAELNSIKIPSEDESKRILKELEGADYKVSNVEEKKTEKNPSPPFITSTLQQEASRKLGFSVKKTMLVAQQLYEGIDLGQGETGIITYMRTDSFNLAKSALQTAKEVIAEQFGQEYVLETPRTFKGRKAAQEAHEAIRPVNLKLRPEEADKFLDKDQARLYELIWKRTIACQMKEAILNKTIVSIEAEKNGVAIGYLFRALGQTVLFPGFIKVYTEGFDAEEENLFEGEKLLPKVEMGEKLNLQKLNSTQSFTKAPPRYTEASLVKKLESEGIGRPSTYAPTISTIITRGYIKKEKKLLVPTDLAMVVTDVLVENFPNIVDYKFTAEMEEKLDNVEEGKQEWVPMIREFYEPFHAAILEKDKTLKKSDIVNEESEEICDKCGKKMVVKLGRFGKFLSCSGYPECKNKKSLGGSAKEAAEDTPEIKALKEKHKDDICEKCGAKMIVKIGPFSPFLGCSAYPACRNLKPLVAMSGVKCPKCETGQLAQRRTRKGGRVFWGCNKYPKCKFATWNKPVGIDEATGKLKVEDKNGEVMFYEEKKMEDEE